MLATLSKIGQKVGTTKLLCFPNVCELITFVHISFCLFPFIPFLHFLCILFQCLFPFLFFTFRCFCLCISPCLAFFKIIVSKKCLNFYPKMGIIHTNHVLSFSFCKVIVLCLCFTFSDPNLFGRGFIFSKRLLNGILIPAGVFRH